MPRVVLVCFYFSLFFSWCLPAEAAGRFEFTPKAITAYNKVINLRFQEAKQLIFQIKYEDPENLIVYHIENYIDFFTIFINEDKAEFQRLERNKEYRLKQLQKGDKKSPYYLYTQAEIQLQWALARLKFEEYLSAFSEVKAAYKQLRRNEKRFPNFIANKKSLGILHAMVGTVPDNYKWGVKLLGGMSGTIEAGRREVEAVLNYSAENDFIFEEETLVMYSFLLLYLKNQDDEAWTIIRSGKLDPASNPLACFALANVAMRMGKNDKAIELLKSRPRGPEYMEFHYLDFMLGTAKLHRLDADADLFIKKYLQKFKGRNYIKQAYQKLAWFHFLQGNEAGYRQNMQRCRQKGETIIGGDKNALKEAKAGQLPEETLLRCRLLFDGGYYQRAYDLLQAKQQSDFFKKSWKLEYTYRLGRITHRLERLEAARKFYQETIDLGRNESWFYACNAALQIGLIYEKEGQVTEAKSYFNQCLDMSPDDYRSSLHHKAKAGLNRLN